MAIAKRQKAPAIERFILLRSSLLPSFFCIPFIIAFFRIMPSRPSHASRFPFVSVLFSYSLMGQRSIILFLPVVV
jgi:hypothetical protein